MIPASSELVVLALGSNMGNRCSELQAGLEALAARRDILLQDVSGVWESTYVGPGDDQADYFNSCCTLITGLTPQWLLEAVKIIERGRGRADDAHMQPRLLDIDILLFGQRIVDDPDLKIPHPRLHERSFVLEPMNEIAPGMRVPDSGETVRALCEKIRGAEGSGWCRLTDDCLRIPGRG